MKTRILLVEDDPATVDVMRLELEHLDYEVTVATNGIEALDIASAQLPDLIVLDIFLPKMDGLEVAARLRKNPKTKDIPVLAATAKALPDDREKCLAAGCNDYIAKPFSHRELGAALKKLLGE